MSSASVFPEDSQAEEFLRQQSASPTAGAAPVAVPFVDDSPPAAPAARGGGGGSSSGAAKPVMTPSSPSRTRQQDEDDERTFVDEFGFELSDEEAIKREECYVRTIDGKRVLRREVKWAQMTADWSRTNVKMYDKLKDRARKGIPSKLRGVAWQLLTGSRSEMESGANRGVYNALKLKKIVDKDMEGIIERDLNRTFPTHVLFRDDDGAGQTKLRNVLHAYACIDPEVSYVQGMGFIVATLLTQMDEEESFWCFHAMMNHERYRLRDMYKPGFPMLQMFFYQLQQLLKQQIPRLSRHFEQLGVDMSFFAAQWFLTLFVYHFQFRALLRVWDIFLCEGFKIIFRTAIALMKWDEEMLLSLPFDQILPALKNLHENKNPDEIVVRALKVKFKTEELLKWRKEYELQLTLGRR